MTFEELGLNEKLLDGLSSLGYKHPTPIQEQTIPEILDGRDIIGCAQTGTGKTAAFLLPICHRIITGDESNSIKCLIVVPTRELAIQIDQQLQGISYFTGISAIAVYGGSGGDVFSQEKKALSEGADIVIATPGRLLAHLAMNYADMSGLQFLVLDEADRMLEMGFYPDIMKIISNTPEERQSLLFSATMPPKIRELAKDVLNNPFEVSISISMPPDKIVQIAFSVYEEQKISLIGYLLEQKQVKSAIIFCSTKENTKALTRALKKLPLNISEIHSDLDQKQRGEVMNAFRARNIQVLVATDIISRGIDIDDIEMIINFDVPDEGEDYVHRIGRTARASSTGLAITLINPMDQFKFAAIERLISKTVPKAKVPDSLGPAPIYDPKSRPAYGKTRFSPKRAKKRRP